MTETTRGNDLHNYSGQDGTVRLIGTHDVDSGFITNYEQISIKDLTGKYILFNPQKLLNKGILLTRQNHVEDEKLLAAIEGDGDKQCEPIVVSLRDVTNSKGRQKRIVCVECGNHRIAIACLNRQEVVARVYGECIDEHIQNMHGFQKMRNEVTLYLGNLQLLE
ncbi:hypothetical protein JW796_03565 [Candidatus Dojkabacteria bacterium]|nr:hypothetical protein [Candidatus Dojkabacteria bacterium]